MHYPSVDHVTKRQHKYLLKNHELPSIAIADYAQQISDRSIYIKSVLHVISV